MKANELKRLIADGALSKYAELYNDIEEQKGRFLSAIDDFTALYGDEREAFVFSVPGRSEIIGNHTDHNRGKVMAGAITKDIIAIVAKRDDGLVRFKSEGYDEIVVSLSDINDPKAFEDFSSAALVAGVAKGFSDRGYTIGGFDAYSVTEVLKGSGISSSAAFEVMVGNIINHLYAGGEVDNIEIAKIAQFAENVYFGKPSGLMDQMACAVGGFVYIDFACAVSPVVEPLDFSLADHGYALCIVNTGGNHADLNADYASVPEEMRSVARSLGHEVLCGVSECELVSKIPEIRESLGDRALLRALHFIRENERVEAAKSALLSSDISEFLKIISASGKSSFEYLQNVYTTINVKEQGLSLALALTDAYLGEKRCAFRVHGGGFAGTIQVFIPRTELAGYVEYIESVFGKGTAMPLSIRPVGACRLF